MRNVRSIYYSNTWRTSNDFHLFFFLLLINWVFSGSTPFSPFDIGNYFKKVLILKGNVSIHPVLSCVISFRFPLSLSLSPFILMTRTFVTTTTTLSLVRGHTIWLDFCFMSPTYVAQPSELVPVLLMCVVCGQKGKVHSFFFEENSFVVVWLFGHLPTI